MVSGMNLLAGGVMGIIAVLTVHLLCKWNYIKGRVEGKQEEAMEWCKAYDAIQVPNWQSLPIPRDVDRDKQIEANKVYVEVFRTAKEIIGRELVANRVDAIREEWKQLGAEFPE